MQRMIQVPNNKSASLEKENLYSSQRKDQLIKPEVKGEENLIVPNKSEHKTVSKKLTVQIEIQASCFSIELRKASNELITEFCLVNFDYGVQLYANGGQRRFFKAYSFFIFHNEDPVMQSKQVMFGHINANTCMITTKDFYHTLPEKLREKKEGEASAKHVKMRTQKISYEMIVDP